MQNIPKTKYDVKNINYSIYNNNFNTTIMKSIT